MENNRTVMQPMVLKDATFEILKNTNVPEQSAINELVDNALDANATVIEIDYDANDMSVKDNGFGMSTETLAKAFDVGNHLNKEATFGRYGYGLALCSLRYTDSVKVSTDNGEVKSMCHILTKKYGESAIIDSEPSDVAGTTIELIGHSFKRRNAITKNLAFYYGDLIENGKLTIKVNGTKLESTMSKDVVLQEDRQTATINWEGKRAIVTAGLLAEGLPISTYAQFSGATFTYNGKVIESGIKDLFAFNNKTVSEVAFFVEIIDVEKAWRLSSNKDDVLEKEEFFSSEVMEPMVDKWLDRSDQKRTIVKMVELQGFVMDLLNDVLGNRNRKRRTHTKDKDSVGAEPKQQHLRVDRDRPERDIKDGNSGEGSGFKFLYTTVGALIGYEFSRKNKGLRIVVNYCHPNYHMLQENKEAAKVYVMGVLANFLVEEDSIDKDAIEERFKGSSFGVIFDNLNQASVGISLGDYIKEDAGNLSFDDRAARVR